MTELEKAKALLKGNGYTCVLCKGEMVISSYERGVKPLLGLFDSDTDVKGSSAADKVVGKAAAYLYVLIGIHKLYTDVISIPALEVLNRYDIHTEYSKAVNAIRNRTNTGFCPMETAVADINEPNEALIAIREKLKQLNK